MRTIVKIGAAIIGIIWYATSDITPRKQETEYQSFNTTTVENYKEPAPSARGKAYEFTPDVKPLDDDSLALHYDMQLPEANIDNGYKSGSADDDHWYNYFNP